MPVPRNVPGVSDVLRGRAAGDVENLGEIPSWVAAMLRSTLARPRALSTGAATKPGSVPSSEGQYTSVPR